MEISLSYIYVRLPLFLLFMTGYILYRVISTVGLPEYIAARAVRLSRGKTDLLLLSLICVSAWLSMFIPNAVTVLAMIPVIRRLDSELTNMTTPLALSIIYGANIGGMGSLIGSPANLLLIGALDYFDVPGREKITFLNWFEWALPLVLVFLLLAWIIVRFAVPPEGKFMELCSGKKLELQTGHHKGIKAFIAFLCFWITSSLLVELTPHYRTYEPLLAFMFAGLFCFYVFGSGLLRWNELAQGVPVRGVIFLGVLGILIFVVHACRLDEEAADMFRSFLDIMEQGNEGYLVYLVTALWVILLTEFLSNTVVSTAFFAVIAHVGIAYGFNPLPLMVLVSAASTCAFMTPIATPCNSLVVGEMRGISLKTMAWWGMILNMLGALLLSFWMWKVVSYVYS